MKKIFFILFLLAIFNINAATNNHSLSSDITNLGSSKDNFPACIDNNDSWIEQSGINFVQITAVPQKALVLNADEIIGQESGVTFVSGNVIGYKEDKTLSADWVAYNQQTSHMVASNVILTRQYNQLTGQWIDYYFDLDTGLIKDATVFNYKNNMYAKGQKIYILNSKDYQVESGLFTSCNIANPDWQIKAKDINFDYKNNQGYAHDAMFYASKIPILYTPYLQFPLGQRKSGFLIPELGEVPAGKFIGIPYYLNLAPNYDATITPRIYDTSGILIAGEVRYLTQKDLGNIYTEQLPSNWQTGAYRYYWNLSDTHIENDELSAGYTFSQVSDNNYFTDFGNFNSMTNNINLERAIFAHYTPSWGQIGIKIQGFQTLYPSNQPQTPSIYSTAPQIDININQQNIGDSIFSFGMINQYTNFSSDILANGQTSLQTGQRLVLYPNISLPLKKSWGFLTSKIGYNYTYYQLNPFVNFQQNPSYINRQIPIASLDSGLVFENQQIASNKITTTFEPRIYYLYIPQISQANIPIFDTAQASPNLNQLFSENRFAGFDRINSANDVTMGFTSRILSNKSGDEFMNFGLGYRYYLTPNNNLLYGSYTQFPQLYQPNPNMIAELSNTWGYGLSTNANFQYDNIFNNINGYSAQIRYNPDIHKIVNLRFNYQYQAPIFYYAWTFGQGFQASDTENQYSLDLSGQWPLFSERWLLDSRFNYDFTRQQFLNILGGLEYDAGCWSVNVMAEEYLVGVNQYKQAYFLQFNLGGFVNIGSDPTGDLRLNIPGYVPIPVVK